ncbi:oxidoreductase, zinc-binding dehydrogenase family [gamma proteobacterium HdN1]|nr:oxidoreductase, zinc-binding dehydrogenase family [gamma proteobacterium HdN1]
MKAAVLHAYGEVPKYEDLPKPQQFNESQALLKIEAASIKQLDQLKASGKHYTRYEHFPVAVGVDGVGRLVSGRRVYAMGLSGMIAEYALVNLADCVTVPEGMDAALAAVLPNALLGSDAALLCRANFCAGDNVLINGATGVSGRMAVQAARLRGANKIIVTGRSAQSLADLSALGADVCISLLDSPEEIIAQMVEIQQNTPINVVLDYLWGEPVLWILRALNRCCPTPVNIITIGQMAGAEVSLPSGLLRSKPISILGSGLGSITASQLREYNQMQLAYLFEQAAKGRLSAGYQRFALEDVEHAWQVKLAAGERAVVVV